MKRLLLLFFFLKTLLVSAQWVHQNSGTTDMLFDVFFPTKDTGYVSGSAAGILKTTNGGANWNVIPNSLQAAYLYFTSRDTGYAISNDSILKTVNGGVSWVVQYSNLALYGIGAIYFSDKLTGYTSGLNNNQDTMYFIKTINGGNTWNIVSWITDSITGFFLPFTAVSFVSQDTGFFSGWSSKIYKTVNGCANVTSVFNSIAVIESIHFPTKDTGYATGYPDALVKTTNRGNSWTILPTASNNEAYLDVFFTTKDTGYIASDSGSFYGKILKTTDGGNNWVTQITDTNIIALCFPSRTIGYAVGANGTILKYTGVIGIEEIDNNGSSLVIYPNPTPGKFILQSTIQSFSHSTITVYNSLGEVVFQSAMKNQQSEIDLSSHPAGIYFLKVGDDNKMAVKKIVKL